MYRERKRKSMCEIGRTGWRTKGEREARNGEAGMEGELRWIANSSHINKREDIVCEAAEKPPSLQPPRRSASPASRGLSKLIKNT